MSCKSIILGTRGSRLALTQAHMVKEALEKLSVGIEVGIKIITTTGDKRTDVPLAEVAKVAGVFDKGVFLKELEVALEGGEIDLAVHSLKDMPSELAPQFCLAGVLPRASVEDVLIIKEDKVEKIAHIATGSVRRRKMAERYWGGDVSFSDIRGNVQTRLSKLVSNDLLDGIILAKAGLERLGYLEEKLLVEGVALKMQELPIDHFLPAAGQGIIGVEVRDNDISMKEMIGRINDLPAYSCAMAEREFLRLLGADCSTPIGVYASIDGEIMQLSIALYSNCGKEPVILADRGDIAEPLALAKFLYDRLDKVI